MFVVTNNHYRGKGITNTVMLRSLVEGERQPAPPGLFAEYGEALDAYAWPAEPEKQPE